MTENNPVDQALDKMGDLVDSATGGRFTDQIEQAKKTVHDQLTSEEATDAVLDKARDAASGLTGGRFDAQLDAARDAADPRLGSVNPEIPQGPDTGDTIATPSP